ncbi:hypothetical protein ACC674_36840, partial [Rhizobium ruizarguesonis]
PQKPGLTVRHVSEHLSAMYPGFTSRPGMTERGVGFLAKLAPDVLRHTDSGSTMHPAVSGCG